jgi:NAD(P)-dependent dehydrogenase (short-subunit alcohol dehydrogenase family)
MLQYPLFFTEDGAMATALITGSNRGLGLEFVRQFVAVGCDVIATCRNPDDATKLRAEANAAPGKIEIYRLDAANRGSIDQFAAQLRGRPIDYLVCNAGISGNKTGAANELDEAQWIDVFRTNVMGPTFLAGALVENVAASERRVMAFVSTRQAIIRDNVKGRYYMYRSSKTALNACIKNLSIDNADKGIACIAFHPGFVRTDMGGPGGAIDAETSVNGLMKLFLGSDKSYNGKFFEYTGIELNW